MWRRRLSHPHSRVLFCILNNFSLFILSNINSHIVIRVVAIKTTDFHFIQSYYPLNRYYKHFTVICGDPFLCFQLIKNVVIVFLCISIASTSGYTCWKPKLKFNKYFTIYIVCLKSILIQIYSPFTPMEEANIKYLTHVFAPMTYNTLFLHHTPLNGLPWLKDVISPSWDSQNTTSSSCLTIRFFVICLSSCHISHQLSSTSTLNNGHHLKFF